MAIVKLRERDGKLFAIVDLRAGECVCLLARQETHTKERNWQLTRECALMVSGASSNVRALKTLSKLFAMASRDIKAGEALCLATHQLEQLF